jgi:hypothetical protein
MKIAMEATAHADISQSSHNGHWRELNATDEPGVFTFGFSHTRYVHFSRAEKRDKGTRRR